MSTGASSLVLVLLFCAASAGSAQKALSASYDDYDYTTTTAPFPLTSPERPYKPKDEIQPLYYCGGYTGSMLATLRKALEDLPNRWTHPDTGGRNAFNVTAIGLDSLVEDRPFLAYCKNGVPTVKLTLFARNLGVDLYYNFLSVGLVPFRVDTLRVEIDYQDLGTSVHKSRTYYRDDDEIHVEIREITDITVEGYAGWLINDLKDRLTLAFYDIIQRLLGELFKDALRYNIGDSLDDLKYAAKKVNKK